MGESKFPFVFDVNFSFGKDSVFSEIYSEFDPLNPPPPVPGYFLELQGGPFLLLSGEKMALL